MKKIYLVLPLLILGCSDTNFNYPESEKNLYLMMHTAKQLMIHIYIWKTVKI